MKFNPKWVVIKSEPLNLSIQFLMSIVRQIFSSICSHSPFNISKCNKGINMKPENEAVRRINSSSSAGSLLSCLACSRRGRVKWQGSVSPQALKGSVGVVKGNNFPTLSKKKQTLEQFRGNDNRGEMLVKDFSLHCWVCLDISASLLWDALTTLKLSHWNNKILVFLKEIPRTLCTVQVLPWGERAFLCFSSEWPLRGRNEPGNRLRLLQTHRIQLQGSPKNLPAAKVQWENSHLQGGTLGSGCSIPEHT